MSKPSLLIASPAYAGLYHLGYLESLIDTIAWVAEENIPFNFYGMGNESLITRARNTCATLALEQGYDKILFVDSDISWKRKDIWRLFYSDKKIIGGTYPIKGLPINLNFNALQPHFDKYNFRKSKSPEKFRAYAKEYANDLGEVEVEHLPTGFMMIDCSVLKDLAPKTPKYESNHILGSPFKYFYDFFQCGAHEGRYRSEDWAFCELARANGHSVWLNTNVILPHTGTFTFWAE